MNEPYIEIVIDLKKREPLNYILGQHLYHNYIKHFIDNKEDNMKIHVIFHCGDMTIPFGFIAGITDELLKDDINLDNMEFKVNSIEEDKTIRGY